MNNYEKIKETNVKHYFIFILLLFISVLTNAHKIIEPDFKWANSNYYNLNVGDSVTFKGVDIVLIEIENHYNTLAVGNDTLKLKVSRRSLPVNSNSVRLFVADNRNVKKLAQNKKVHGLLKKDALICLSETKEHMTTLNSMRFPVSYNDGFRWTLNEDNHMFSYLTNGCESDNKNTETQSYEGIGIALTDGQFFNIPVIGDKKAH